MAIHTKPIVVGGGVFSKDGWLSTLLPMTSLANGYHGNNDASTFQRSSYLLLFTIKALPFTVCAYKRPAEDSRPYINQH